MPSNTGNVSTIDILNVPQPTKEPGQRSMRVSDAYFARMIPGWSQPSVLTPGQWRAWVAAQPVAVTCKETMISNISDLDWKITPRKSDQRDELKGTIDHYEKLFRNGGYSGLDWIGFLEWFLSDLNDLPFGTAWEVGRKGDGPDGRVAWLEPLDGGTLYPTNNKDTPVIQYYNNFYASFPAHAIARAYLNPRPEIERKGWGIAPPERVFLAMEMLARGDRYYANLLLDIPPIGIFDLADITWEDAHTWIESFRSFTTGGAMESFRIPVLAEHQKDVKFIPLGKDPNAIMYDIITLKYASLVCAAYGMTLSDIGLQGSSASGETLAGSIRGEQKTNRTGKARNKGKIKFFIESILPQTLQFDFIDTDGERLSMLGRARLANATAMNQYREMEAISPEEARLQAIQDGLFTISMPEKPPAEAKKPIQPVQPFGSQNKKPAERPGSVGNPQPPSLGGDGEVKKSLSFTPKNLDQSIENIVKIIAPNIYEVMDLSDPEPIRSAILESIFLNEDNLGLGSVIRNIISRVGEFEGIESLDFDEEHLESLKSRISDNFPEFIGKAIVYTLAQSELLLNPRDVDGFADFSELADEVKLKINKSLPDYLMAHVGIEMESMEAEREAENLSLPEPVRFRAVQKPTQPINITVNPPNITMPNINIPDITVNVPATNVDVQSPTINVNPSPITVESPVVNLSVPEKEVNIQVDAKQDAPIVNLSQPSIQVNVPQQPSPIVNVEVSPTPVTVENTVHLPESKPVKREITIVKASDNVWHGEAKQDSSE